MKRRNTEMKKTVSSAAAALIAFTAVSTASADDQKYFSPKDLSGHIDYMTGKAGSAEIRDANGDGVVNILDTIYIKNCILSDYSFYQHILSCADYDSDICSNEKLSSMASVIHELISEHLLENIQETDPEDKKIYMISSDDGSEFSEIINTELQNKYGYRNMKWMAKYRQAYNISVLCTVNGENTGSYPAPIPDDVHIPYDEYFLHNIMSFDFDWRSYYSSTVKLNEEAGKAFQFFSNLINTALKNGKISEDELAGNFIIDSQDLKGTYFEDTEDSIKSMILKYNTNWVISGKDGIPCSVIITNLSGKTGAFPAAVPQNLDIDYAPDLIEYASGNKKWKDDFADCISEDPERSNLPDYPEISDDDALFKAAALYNAVEWWYASDNEFIPEDGTYSSDNAFETIPEIMKYPMIREAMTAFSHEHYLINVKNGIIVSVEYINDAYGKKAFADKTVFDEYVNTTEQKESENHFTGSSQIINGSGDKVIPVPDHTLYYSTDEENYDLSVLKYKKASTEKTEDISGTSEGYIPGNSTVISVPAVVTGDNTLTGSF